jgi:hypothetical protein
LSGSRNSSRASGKRPSSASGRSRNHNRREAA